MLRTLLKTATLLEALTRHCARSPQVNLPLQMCATACAESIVGGCTATEFSKAALRLEFPAVIQSPWSGPPAAEGARQGEPVKRGLSLSAAADSDSLPASALLAAVALRATPRLWSSEPSPEMVQTDLTLLQSLFQGVFSAAMPFMAILAPLRQLRRALERHWVRNGPGCVGPGMQGEGRDDRNRGALLNVLVFFADTSLLPRHGSSTHRPRRPGCVTNCTSTSPHW